MIIGIDVSKDTLVTCTPDGAPAEVANTPTAIATWLPTLPETALLAMEATGRYHRAVADQATARGLTVYVFNPRDVHRYAQSLSPRAATDPLAARVIARFAATAPHPVYQTPRADVEEVKTLGRQRAALVRQQVQLAHQAREAPLLVPVLASVRAALATTVDQVTAQLEACVRQTPAMHRLLAIPGIGPVTAAYLGALLATHAFRTSDAFVAYLGLDLRVKDSGKLRGARRLSKRGDPEARRVLYMAGLAAGRYSTEFGTIRDRALATGHSKTEAIVIVARKLARTAWSLYTHETAYEASRVLANR
jgi:transposase